MAGTCPVGLKESQIVHPSDTVVLGEKESFRGDFYMDMLAGHGDDFAGVVTQGRTPGAGRAPKPAVPTTPSPTAARGSTNLAPPSTR